MTAPMPPVRVAFEDFHRAISAAMCAGWKAQRPAHDAVVVMLSAGVPASQIVWLFLDAKRRLQ